MMVCQRTCTCPLPTLCVGQWNAVSYRVHRRLQRSLVTRLISVSCSNPGILQAPGLLPRQDPSQRGNGQQDLFQLVLKRASSACGMPLELCRRILVTMCMLLLARIGHYIPLPGVHGHGVVRDGTTQSLTAAMTSASEVDGNIYLLSITPYMTASITLAALQLIPEVKRHIESLREEGRSGREAINAYTNTLFIFAAMIQSISYALKLASESRFLQLQYAVTLMAGAVLCKFAVQNIDQHGLGDGTGVIIGAGIAMSYSEYISQIINHIRIEHLLSIPWYHTCLAASTVLATVILVTWVQGIELRLPLTFFSARRGQHARGSRGAYIHHPVTEKLRETHTSIDMQALFPLRLSPSGTRQLLFANFWVSFLDPPLTALGFSGLLNNPFAFALVVFLFEALNFADATPKQIATFLSQNDAGIVGISPGEETRAFLKRKKGQLKFINAAFIAMISLLARAIDVLCIALIGFAPGTLNLLLLVSTVLGGARQVEALVANNAVEKRLEYESKQLDSLASKC
jgi:preprotein translocase subunit SecY